MSINLPNKIMSGDKALQFMKLSPMTVKPYLKILIPLGIILILSYVPLFLPANWNELFTQEEKIFETLSAVYFFVAALLYIAAYFRAGKYHSDSHTWLKRRAYLVLALFFFLSAGEEISWGQRILNTGDSELVRSINSQNETNIHNLKWIDPRGEAASFPLTLLYPGTLFLIFTLSVWLVVPLIAEVYGPAKRFFASFMPIFPWQLFLLMILNFALFFGVKTFLNQFPDIYHHSTMYSDWAITEVIEHGTALILMVIATYLVFVTLAPSEQ
jgi:hypothetical protein